MTPDMQRVDGTQKSETGFLGPIPNTTTGKTMTEVSMGIEIDGEEVLIPLLVPTLTEEEIKIMQNMEIEGNIENVPQSIKDKAIEHAIQRMKENKNPFYNNNKAEGGPIRKMETPKERKEYIGNWLADNMDLPEIAIKGLLGNIHQETGGTFSHTQLQDEGRSGTGYGLIQFSSPGQKEAYFKFVENNNLQDSIDAQLLYIKNEFDTGDQIGGKNARRLRNIIFDPNLTIEQSARAWSDILIQPGTPHMDRRIKYSKSAGGFIDMQEGGNVESQGMITSLDTGVIQDETPTTIDTTQGFYSVNPAPGESGADFAARNPLPTLEERFPVGETKPFVPDPLEFKPPEGYVSPRITTPLSERLGLGSVGSTTGDLAKTGAASVPVDTSLSRDELAALGLLGTMGDVSVGMAAVGDTSGESIFTTTSNPAISDSFSTFDITKDYLLDASNVDFLSTLYPVDRYATDLDFKNRVDGWVLETNKLRGNQTPYTFQQGVAWLNLQDKITEIGSMDVTSALREAATVKIGGNRTLANYMTADVANEQGINTKAIQKSVADSLNIATEEDIKLGGIFDTVDAGFFENLGNTHLFKIGGTENVQLKDLYDEFGAALLVGLATGDAGKAALAGGIQFAQTDLIEAYGQKAYDVALAASNGNVNEASAARQKITGWGGAAIAAAGALILGGELEDAAFAATQHLAIEFGAEKVGQVFGLTGGAEGSAIPVGAGIISGMIALLRTGDIKQAAASGITGYAMATNPILGVGLMALQFLLAKKPSNKTGYASVDFDEFTSQSYSIGDYDASKMNEDNVEFTKKLLDPIIPLIQKMESDYGFDLKGDLQIHYGARDGLYYTIADIDQEGLTRRDMFLNRADYWDGRDQNVYRKTFATDEAGLADFYNSILEDLEYIAKNKITNLRQYRGIQKSPEETRQMLADSGFNISNFTGIKQGGKISLDKGGNVQYNKGNYGLVNKKGKAPPSARADDVPMTLKEGDFVLSQPAVALYGKDTIDRMLSRAATDAGKNLKSGGKVPVNVHNGEYIIPKNLTEYIGPNVLETMNNRGLMSVGERPNT